MADDIDSEIRHSWRAEPSDPWTGQARAEKIEAVSGALMARRSLLDRKPQPDSAKLSAVARSIGGIVRRSKAAATRKSPIHQPEVSLGLTRAQLPEDGSTTGSKTGEEHPEAEAVFGSIARGPDLQAVGAEGASASTARSNSPPPQVVKLKEGASGRPAVVTEVARTSPDARDDHSEGSTRHPTRLADSTVATTRSSPSTAGLGESLVRRDTPDDGDRAVHLHVGSAVRDAAGHLDSIRRADVGHPKVDASVAARISAAIQPASDPTRRGEDSRTPTAARNDGGQDVFTRASHPSPGDDRSSDSSVHGGPTMHFVRNPLSSGFRDHSLSGPSLPEQGGSASDQGWSEASSSDLAPGQSTPPQGGGSVDLSRTNELLQQLIDAVRKQRGSSLPSGGPSVYPDR